MITNFDITTKTKESEYWHAKSLEVASTFLPSDCPLLNHVLLSYQKHHAPSSTSIVKLIKLTQFQPENSTTEEVLEVMKPLLGIENNKFQPIIKRLQNLNVELSPITIKSSKQTVKKLLKQIKPEVGSLLAVSSIHNESNAQKSTVMKTPTNFMQGFNKEKIRKILKFEKIMKKFCKDVGVDKMTLMTMMLGKNAVEEIQNKNEFSSSRKDPFSIQKDNKDITPHQAGINTGQAAQLAYNNIV